MRFSISIFCLLCLSSTLPAQAMPSSLLAEVLEEYPNVRDLALSENEAYFTVQSPLGEISVLMVSQKVLHYWRKPEIASFSGLYSDLEPFLSSDGKRLYFASNRPLNSDSTTVKDYDLWMVQRDGPKSKWSAPVNLGSPVNSVHNEFYPSLALNGNLYFTSDRPDSKGKDDIFLSVWKSGAFENPISLSDSINSPGYEFNAFIAPDESYLIFSAYNRADGLGSGDLYISFRGAANSWTAASNLGFPVNSKFMDYCPFVDSDSQTLYFTSRRSETAVPAGGFTNAKALLKELNKHSNGLSRLYQSRFKIEN
jgi:hypothetical protein